MDSIEYLEPDNINGLNLYCYCGCNPVMRVDPSGHIAFFIVTAIIGAVIGGIVAGSIAYSKGERGWALFGWIGLGIVGGALLGALGGMIASSLVVGNMFANFQMFYTGLKGLAWAYSMGGPGAALIYMANNFFNAIHVNSSWLGYWPRNNGFSEQPQTITLQPGTIIQRIGDSGGKYVAPYFSDPMSLPLPYHQLGNMNNPTLYVVTKPISVLSGQVAPWFYQYGGGMQYILPQSIDNLEEFLSKT